MRLEVQTWLYHILTAVQEIESYFEGTPDDYTLFLQDGKTKRAVERNLEIIGEALSRILKEEPGITVSNSRKIVDTRNKIIHGYEDVSDEILWGIVINHLPVLKQEAEQLLGE